MSDTLTKSALSDISDLEDYIKDVPAPAIYEALLRDETYAGLNITIGGTVYHTVDTLLTYSHKQFRVKVIDEVVYIYE